MQKELSAKDLKKRDLILNGDMWSVVFYIATPLAIFQWMQMFFKVFDTIIASHISPMSVSAVAYLSQITNMIIALGTGLSIGSCIKIGEAYGAGNYELVHKMVNTLFKLCMYVAIVVGVCVPFSSTFLRVLGTPEDFVFEGSVYFGIILSDCVINFFSTAYIAVERMRGNTSRILCLNLVAFMTKLILSVLFVFVFNSGIAMIGVATLASDSVIFLAFIYNLCIKGKGDIFSISSYNLKLDMPVVRNLLKMSSPVIGEKFIFQFGRYLTAVLASGYGSLVSGAFSVSNNIGGMIISLCSGFQDAGSAIISQNRGAGKNDRSLHAFYRILIINVGIAFVGFIGASAFLPEIASIFDGGDPEFSMYIQDIYLWEVYSLVPQAIFAAVCALLYGYGYTKLSMILNFVRLFVLRVPVLWFFQNYTDLGHEAAGISMAISNGGIGIIGGIISIFLVIKIKKGIEDSEKLEEEVKND
ncbi:MAG: MATE family efflux transporter [Clostridia bacterium]